MMKAPLTFQELAERYGIKDYPDFRAKIEGQLSRERARQIWYGQTGIGFKHAALLSRLLDIPYEEVRCVVPLRHKTNDDGGGGD